MNALERKARTYRVCPERKWMHWRGKLEPTECVLKGTECTREESWNLGTEYVLKGNECTGEESWNVSLKWVCIGEYGRCQHCIYVPTYCMLISQFEAITNRQCCGILQCFFLKGEAHKIGKRIKDFLGKFWNRFCFKMINIYLIAVPLNSSKVRQNWDWI